MRKNDFVIFLSFLSYPFRHCDVFDGGQGYDVHDHGPNEGLLDLFGLTGSIPQPLVFFVHADDQPLELVPVHALAICVAEYVPESINWLLNNLTTITLKSGFFWEIKWKFCRFYWKGTVKLGLKYHNHIALSWLITLSREYNLKKNREIRLFHLLIWSNNYIELIILTNPTNP